MKNFVVFVAVCLLCFQLSVGSLTEKEALQEFYDSLQGDDWNWPSTDDGNSTAIKWDFETEFPSDPCLDEWYGVECACQNDDDCHVIALSLFEFNLQGTLPSTIQYLPHLVELDLESNAISGTIPSSICTLVHMDMLILAKNFLIGSLPHEIGNLNKLRVLDLGYNYKMTGVMPASITNMTKLEELIFRRLHHVTGTLPQDIGSMTELRVIYISHTKMSGSLPASISNLTKLRQLRLQLSHFSGTLPSDLGNLQSLVLFNMFHNDFTGRLPDSITTIPTLRHFLVHNNHFTGTIPHDLGELSTLTNFACAHNYLVGSLPNGMTKLQNIVAFYVRGNMFTGRLPEDLGNMTSLSYFNTEISYITGTIPDSIYSLPNLHHLRVWHAMLEGTISESLGHMSQLIVAFMGSNALTGTLPATLTGMSSLERLGVDLNQLTGTIPDGVGGMLSLNHIYFDGNQFTGTLPNTMINLVELVELFVHENQFTGTFPALVADELTILQLNDNRFTGMIPPVFTDFPSITVALMQNNKFTGRLLNRDQEDMFYPNMSFLTHLDVSENKLDGNIPAGLFHIPSIESVAIADNCIENEIPETACEAEWLQVLVLNGMNAACGGSALGYQNKGGTIPHCLLNMSTLSTLQLAGNGITGSMPDVLEISPALTNLVLAHNELRGSLPVVYQTREWANLELSYNKLSHSLYTGFVMGADTHLSLSVNRLSGKVPSSFHNAEHINVLKGSLFECPYVGDKLPTHDSEAEIYTCGTNPLNIVLAIWLGLFIAFSSALAMQTDIAGLPKLRHKITWTVIENLKNTFRTLTLLICLVVCPIYIALSYYYKNYSYSYAWILSGVYLNGSTAGGLMIMCWFGSLFYFLFSCEHFVFRTVRESSSAKIRTNQAKVAWSKKFFLVALVLSNIAIAVVLNGLFVYIQLNHGAIINAFAQIGLAYFKLVWNRFLLPMLLFNKRIFSTSLREDPQNRIEMIEKIERQQVLTECLLIVFNNIVAPMVATMTVDVNCFYNLRYPAPTVVANYDYTYCYIEYLDGVCAVFENTQITTSFEPSFSYSYQCSSALVTSYVIVFVFMYIVDIFIRPLLRHQLEVTRDFVRNVLGVEHKKDAFISMKKLVVRMVTSTAILLTFGILFPPLALMIYYSICVDFAELDAIYTNQVHYREQSFDSSRIMNITRSISSLLKLQFPIAALFYAIFLFDIVGDADGVKKGLLVSVITLIVALIGWISSDFFKGYDFTTMSSRVTSYSGEDKDSSSLSHQWNRIKAKHDQEEGGSSAAESSMPAELENDHVQKFIMDDEDEEL